AVAPLAQVHPHGDPVPGAGDLERHAHARREGPELEVVRLIAEERLVEDARILVPIVERERDLRFAEALGELEAGAAAIAAREVVGGRRAAAIGVDLVQADGGLHAPYAG